MGPVDPGLSLGWPPFRGFCPQRWVVEGSYILMPESRSRHYDTIGLTRFFRALADCQTIAILRLTPQRSAHISAAPTANGAYRNIARNCGAGFFDPDGSRLAQGSRPPGRAFYASFVWKGIRRRRRSSVLRPSGWAWMFSSSLVRTSPTFWPPSRGKDKVKSSDGIQTLPSGSTLNLRV